MDIEDCKAIFSRHADTPVPTSAAELHQTAPVLQDTADPGRPGELGKGLFTLETEEALLATVLLLLVSPHLYPG